MVVVSRFDLTQHLATGHVYFACASPAFLKHNGTAAVEWVLHETMAQESDIKNPESVRCGIEIDR
jgi:hypothetical protein